MLGFLERSFLAKLLGTGPMAWCAEWAPPSAALRAAGQGTVVFENVDQLGSAALRDLVRALGERHVTPLGTKERVPFAARVILTTRRELPADGLRAFAALDPAVACLLGDPRIAATLRGAGHLQLIALAERADEVEQLVDHMLHDELLREDSGSKRVVTLSPAAREWLRGYPWPRNLAEARMLVERLVASGHEQIGRVAVARILAPVASPWGPDQCGVEQTRFPGLAMHRDNRPAHCSRNSAAPCRKSYAHFQG